MKFLILVGHDYRMLFDLYVFCGWTLNVKGEDHDLMVVAPSMRAQLFQPGNDNAAPPLLA